MNKSEKTDQGLTGQQGKSNVSDTNVNLSGKHKLSPLFPSHVSANYLCNFMPDIEYLKMDLKDMSLKPRYFMEDISYLGIDEPDFPKFLVYPMLCFCDIPLSKVGIHMKGTDEYTGYGDYGIALKKEFCESQDIQPITYLNPNSRLKEDISAAIKKILLTDLESNRELDFMANTLTSQLMYTKPIQGFMQRDNDKEAEERLFKDECEWRYIPKIPESSDLPEYMNEQIASKEIRNKYSDALNKIDETNFHFGIDDIVYIIVKDEEAGRGLIRYIRGLRNKNIDDKNNLISKIEIAENFDKNLV